MLLFTRRKAQKNAEISVFFLRSLRFCYILPTDFAVFTDFSLRVLRVLRWQDTTMSDVSRTFFVPLSLESSRCRTGCGIIE